MTEVPRALEPSDAERLATLRAAMTHGGAGGVSRTVGQVLDRGLVRAIAGDLVGDDSIEATDSKVDEFTITDDTIPTFGLTFEPIPDSWNVSMGWPFGEDRYNISGRTLTILDPADTFRAVAANGPRTLRVQYDYFTGVPESPTDNLDGPTVVGAPWFRQNAGSGTVKCWWRMEGMAGVNVANDLYASFHDVSHGYQGAAFGNLSVGPQLAGGSYAANIYYGELVRPWYDNLPGNEIDGLRIEVPGGNVIFDLPSPVSVNTTDAPTSYQG